jgi:cytidine deaminase
VTSTAGALSNADRELINAARDAANNSYSRYSKFPVGAALRLRTGEIIAGTNVETGSYGGTICAERAALCAARSTIGAKLDIESLAVVATSERQLSCPPCAICRNMIDELMRRDARVLFLYQGRWIAKTVAQLVPFPFELLPEPEIAPAELDRELG